jgi:hypothetical protein
MISAIHLSPSVDSNPFGVFEPKFDLKIEGLNQRQARSISLLTTDMILGPVVVDEVPTPARGDKNPIADLDNVAQQALGTLVKTHIDRFSNKISAIKLLRSLFPGLGLKDGKDFVDYVWQSILNGPSGVSITGPYKTDSAPIISYDWIKF